MHARPEELCALARNVLVVATCGLNFQSMRGLAEARAGAAMGEGAYPGDGARGACLRGAARWHLQRPSRGYIE
jgi:hypothetical protein